MFPVMLKGNCLTSKIIGDAIQRILFHALRYQSTSPFALSYPVQQQTVHIYNGIFSIGYKLIRSIICVLYARPYWLANLTQSRTIHRYSFPISVVVRLFCIYLFNIYNFVSSSIARCVLTS